MDLLLEKSEIHTFYDEFLHVKFILMASLETRRVIKYKFLVAFEHHFVIDIMDSTLQKVSWIKMAL